MSLALQGLRTPAVPWGAPRKPKSRHGEEAGKRDGVTSQRPGAGMQGAAERRGRPRF